MNENKYKLAILVRKDLKMGKGKIAVQASHASVMASDVARRNFKEWWKAWLSEGQCKIALKVTSESGLIKLKKEAENFGIPTVIVQDKGLTQLEPGTITCVGIGPAPIEFVDKIIKDLSLL